MSGRPPVNSSQSQNGPSFEIALTAGVRKNIFMAKRILLPFAILIVAASAAHADATSDAKAVADMFGRAMTTCDMAALGDLYEDDAVAIYPYVGDEAKGRTEIVKMAKRYCGPAFTGFKQVSAVAEQIAPDYIVNVGVWEAPPAMLTPKATVQKIRTTEVLHKGADGKWRYVVDHASIGQVPPLTPPPPEKT
jgi:uncharacterized protein (TIGR02246 family)